MLDWTLQQMVFGEVPSKGRFLMSACSIPTLLQSPSQSLAATYRKHEKRKSRAYEQRVHEIEHGSFTPLIMSATGGVGAAVSKVGTCPTPALLPGSGVNSPSSLLRSSIQCLRGSRSSPHTPMHPCHLVAFHESGITATGH